MNDILCALIKPSKFNGSEPILYFYFYGTYNILIFDGGNQYKWFSKLLFHVAQISIKTEIYEKYTQNNLKSCAFLFLLFVGLEILHVFRNCTIFWFSIK